MKRVAAIALLVGMALFTAVIAWQGAGVIAQALATVGWGLAVVTLWHLVPLVIDSHAWRLLFAKPRPSFVRIVWARWIGESVNGLLPVAQIGGDIAKARLLIQTGLAAAPTAATVVVDTTLAALGQMLFGLVGLAMLLVLLDRPDLAGGLGIGIAAMLVLLALFYRLQRAGLFAALARAVKKLGGGRDWLDFVGGAAAMDTAIAAIYARPSVVVRGLIWRIVGWFAGVGEVWLACYYMGHPIGWGDALMLEALAQAMRGAAFVIPGALGVVEGGLVLLAPAAGLTAQTGLAIALVKRVRELALGLPGLVAWQVAEGRFAAGRRARASLNPPLRADGHAQTKD